MSADDALMARFFASYISPSERRVDVVPLPEMSAELKAFVEQTNALGAEPVLPEGWEYAPADRIISTARAMSPGKAIHLGTNGELHCFGYVRLGQFPEVERYVLWKNGVTP